MPRCPTCGGLIVTKNCMLCRVRNGKVAAAAPPKPIPPPVIKGFPPKWCKYCGKELKRKRYTQAWERASQYARRKYCNRKCAHKFQYQDCVARGVITDG